MEQVIVFGTSDVRRLDVLRHRGVHHHRDVRLHLDVNHRRALARRLGVRQDVDRVWSRVYSSQDLRVRRILLCRS